MAKVKPAHYRGGYHVLSARVRAAANADPSTRCWRCSRTMAEHRAVNPRDRWEAGHLRDGDPTSPLLPEARSCNRAAGARITNSRKAKRTPLTW